MAFLLDARPNTSTNVVDVIDNPLTIKQQLSEILSQWGLGGPYLWLTLGSYCVFLTTLALTSKNNYWAWYATAIFILLFLIVLGPNESIRQYRSTKQRRQPQQ